jgi:sarcosine oxidase subunit gamma|tara:strand:+ start:301 stop:894 length:594 start_codon:yes stop_codon:yes gene_type:complete
MSSEVRRESPLLGFATEANAQSGIQIRERPFLGHVNLRGDAGYDAFLKAVEGALGFSLPLIPNTVSHGAGLTAVWLGPDEWLIITPTDHESSIVASMESALGDMHTSITDQTGGQTIIRISGPSARDLLAKGCTLDLHPTVFGHGRCAQTLVAKAMGTIMYVDDVPTFDLVVRRSFAEYLLSWIQDAALEYGLARQG